MAAFFTTYSIGDKVFHVETNREIYPRVIFRINITQESNLNTVITYDLSDSSGTIKTNRVRECYLLSKEDARNYLIEAQKEQFVRLFGTD